MCLFAKIANVQKPKSGIRQSGGTVLNSGFGKIVGRLDMINFISFHFAIVALIVLMAGWQVAGNQDWTCVVGDSYSEWLGILIDAMLLYFINWAIRREEREKLISQFSSESNAFALDAAKRLRKKGWLTDGRLRGCDMTNAQLEGANLSRAILPDVDFSYASLQDGFLVEADFSGSNFIGADLRGAECRWANFNNANMRWANLESAVLDGANFDGADLRFAKLGKYNPATVSMKGAQLSQNLTKDEIDLVQNSVQLIRKSTEAFSLAFYRELFKASPSVRTLFLANINDQAQKFAQLFEILVASLNDMEKLLPALQTLGKRHVRYGVEENHYQLVGKALIHTLRKSLGRHFTPEVEAAWLKTYGLVTMVMVDSSKGLM